MHKKILKKIFLASSLIAPVAIVTPIVLTSCSTSDSGGGDSTNPPSGDKTEIGLVGKSLTTSGDNYLLTGKLKGSGDDFKDEATIKGWLTNGDSLKSGGFKKLLESVDGSLKNNNTDISTSDITAPEAEKVNSKVVVTTKSTSGKEDATTFSGTIEVTLKLKDDQRWSNNLDEKPIKFTLATDGVDNPDGPDTGDTAIGFKDDLKVSKDQDSEFFLFYLKEDQVSNIIKEFSEGVMKDIDEVITGLQSEDNGFKPVNGSTKAKFEFKAVLKNEDFRVDIFEEIFKGLTLQHGTLGTSGIDDEEDVKFDDKFDLGKIKDNVQITAEIGLNRYGFTFDLNLTPKDPKKFEWQKGSGDIPLNIYMEKKLNGVYFIGNLDEFKATEVASPFAGTADTQKKQEYKFTGSKEDTLDKIDEAFTTIETLLKTGEASSSKDATSSDSSKVDKVDIGGLKKLVTYFEKVSGTPATASTPGGKADTSSSTKELQAKDIKFDNLTENDENVNPVKATLTKSKSSVNKATAGDKDTITVKIEISLVKDSYWLTNVKDTDAKKAGEAAPTKNSTPITIELVLKKKTTGSGKGF